MNQASPFRVAWSALKAGMLGKSTWTLDGGRPGFSDRDNFTTNRVTVADYSDWQAQHGVAAEGLSATYACVTLIGGTAGSLPPGVMRPGSDGIAVEDRRHPLFDVIHESPNADDSAVDFWDFMASAVELAGNAYAVVERSSTGRIISLTPPRASPRSVRAERRERGRIWYRWNEGGRLREEPQERILHLRGPGGDALGGVSPLSACRAAFGSALGAQAVAGATFVNGVRPSGVLTSEKMFDRQQREDLQEIIEQRFVGAMNSGRPLLLDGGLKWEALSISPEEAQLLESRRFSVEEICRIFGVPPHMIGHVDKTTSWGAGVEQQTIGFLMFTMRRRLKRIEAAATKQLLTASERAQGIKIKFDLRELLRGDSKGRAEYYRAMTGIGAMTINEVRAEEGLGPVPGGDVPRLQSQNVPIDQVPSVGDNGDQGQ